MWEWWINHRKMSMHNGRQTAKGSGVSLDRWSSSDGGTAGVSHMKFSLVSQRQSFTISIKSGETAAYSGHKSPTATGMAGLNGMRHVYLYKKHLFPWFIASFIRKLLWIKAKPWMPHNPAVYSAISVKLLSSIRKWHCRWSQLIRKQKSTFCSCVFLFMTHICTYVQAHTHTEVTDAVNHLWMMALKIIKQ